jgi:GNAT superfamily N-acetyltransferase
VSPAELLDWESEHFGVRIARLRGDVLTEEVLAEADEWCAANRVDCLQLLATPDDAATARLAAERGFFLTDAQITYARTLGTPDDALPPPPESATIRRAREDDVPALRELAGRSHRTGRFHFDERLPGDLCDDVYRRWIERDVLQPEWAVVVAEDGDGIVGYFSSRLPEAGSERTTASIGAVDERGQGRGIGVGMFSASLADVRDAGARYVESRANARNIGSLRLHPSSGFAVLSVGLWYHRWLVPAG